MDLHLVILSGVHKKGRPAGRLKPASAYAKYYYASRPFSWRNNANALPMLVLDIVYYIVSS